MIDVQFLSNHVEHEAGLKRKNVIATAVVVQDACLAIDAIQVNADASWLLDSDS